MRELYDHAADVPKNTNEDCVKVTTGGDPFYEPSPRVHLIGRYIHCSIQLWRPNGGFWLILCMWLLDQDYFSEPFSYSELSFVECSY